MTLIQTWTPDYKFCLLCGKETKGESCSENCANKLDKISFAIEERKKDEQSGIRGWDQNALKIYSELQQIIG